MTIDVIIPTYNRSESLKITLKSILSCETNGVGDFEVIVVDNNSQDNTGQIVQEIMPEFKGRLKYIFEPRQGRNYAINTGILESHGDLIALTDDDCLIDQKWLGKIAANFKQKNLDILSGKIISQFNESLPGWLDLNYKIFWGPIGRFDLGDKYIDNSQKVIFAGGANLILRRSSAEKYGLFAKATRGQDTELCHRWQQQGAKIGYDPDVIVYHQTQSSLLNKNYIRQWQFVSGKNSALIFKEDHESSKRRLARVPLWVYKRLFFAIGKYLKGFFVSKNNFVNEVWVWFQVGFIWGIRGDQDHFEENLNTPKVSINLKSFDEIKSGK